MPAAAVDAAIVVLVVEDDRHARELFRTALRGEGYNVVAIEDGVAALTYLDSHTPSAVVLDLGLPRLHGRDVLAEMAAHGLTRDVPVVVVTGDPDPLLHELDYVCVLRKPIDSDQLLVTVRECIRKRRNPA